MDQFSIAVPYDFIAARVRLTWQEVRFGVDEGIFSPPEAIDFATDLLSEGDDSPEVLNLAIMDRDESVSEVIGSLADRESVQDLTEVRRLWAFLVLAWILEHRSQYPDPLDLAEKVYADLDYPEQLAPFIRYMPSDEPALASPELNEARLFKNWQTYLQAEGKHFASRTAHRS